MLKIENIASKVKITEDKKSDNRSIFLIEPLYKGYGNTLGNSLRRVLLSAIPGCAIKGVKIEGIADEFSVKDGVKENILEILLNIKGVFLKSYTFGDRRMTLNVKGPKIVKASDIKHDNSIEIVNKEEVIAEITGNVELKMEFLVGTGEGFVFADEQNRKDWEVGLMPIDSIYSPIRKVSYKVVETIFAGMTDYEKLMIDIETNGTSSCRDIIGYASEMIIEHFKPFISIGNNLEHIRNDEDMVIEETISSVDSNSVPDLKIEDLDLSVRSYNCLKKADINSLRDLAELSRRELLEIKNLGKSSLKEILAKLEEHNINIDG